MAAEKDFRFWLGWALRVLTEAVSENAEINIKLLVTVI